MYLKGSGFGQRSDSAALIIGPTGVAFCNGTLYVADALYNRIAAIPHALERGTDALSGTTFPYLFLILFYANCSHP